MRAFLRRDSPQESEHDGFVNFKERIFFANVRIHQHINLLPYQQVDDGKFTSSRKMPCFTPSLKNLPSLPSPGCVGSSSAHKLWGTS